MAAQTHLFICLKDNFGVLLHDPATGATAAIDAPEAAPVEAALKATGWKLTDILVTHHHADHTGGIAELKQRHRCRVVAPAARPAAFPRSTRPCGEGDTVKVGKLTARVIETPGHTAPATSPTGSTPTSSLFAGDTLFSIGCGRVIEGTPEMMWQSLLKLRALPDDTRSTAATNTRWRTSASPRPSSRTTRRWPRASAKSTQLLAAGKPTMPTHASATRRPPIRSCAPTCRRSPPRSAWRAQPAAEVFAEIRERKNKF